MKTKKVIRQYRRKEKTNYHKRLSLLKSWLPRLVIRISNKNILAQLVEYVPEGDKILFSASSKELQKKGWKASRKNEPAAYLLGYMIGRKAAGKVKEAILDLGKRRSVTHSKVYAAVKGAIDAGINIHTEKGILPDAKQVNGTLIADYGKMLHKDNKVKYEKVFSLYLKNKLSPEDLPKHIEEIKAKL
jgi:large subunit ribosomal protein L18